MKIEFHNAHGNQLIMRLTVQEAERLIAGVTKSLINTLDTKTTHYAKFDTEFENDNDRWEPTEFDVVVEEYSMNDDCILVDQKGETK